MEGGGRDGYWHRNRLAKHRRSDFARTDSGEDAVIQFYIFPGADIRAQRNLIQSSAFIIIEHALGQFASGDADVIVNVEQEIEFHVSTVRLPDFPDTERACNKRSRQATFSCAVTAGATRW